MKINQVQLEQIRKYTEKTGIPASRVLHEALERYITVVMPARLRTLEKEGLLK